MNTQIIDLAINKQYSNFSNSIKGVLSHKLAKHERITDYTNNIERIENLKKYFSEIKEE